MNSIENQNKAKPIKSFKDLIIYQNTYKAMIIIIKQIIFELPSSEKVGLKDQLGRSYKAIPRLIAEGYAKRHQKLGFQKYLDDAMAECNEMIVNLEQVKDTYNIKIKLGDQLIDIYNKSGRQIYNLSIA